MDSYSFLVKVISIIICRGCESAGIVTLKEDGSVFSGNEDGVTEKNLFVTRIF